MFFIITLFGENIFNAAIRGYLSLHGIQAKYEHKDSASIYYFEGGNKNNDTIILLHGVGGNALTSWFQLMPKLVDKYHVIAPDLFFANLSDLVGSGYHIRIEQRLVEILMQAIQKEKVSIVALSFGAWPALQTAIDLPEKVDNLILISPLSGNAHEILDSLDLDTTNAGQDFFNRIFATPPPIPNFFLKSHWNRTSEVFKALPSFSDQLREEGDFLNRNLDRIQPPTLIIYGNQDRIIGAERFLAMGKQIPGSYSIGLEDCGHAVVWDKPEQLLMTIRQFLDPSSVDLTEKIAQ